MLLCCVQNYGKTLFAYINVTVAAPSVYSRVQACQLTRKTFNRWQIPDKPSNTTTPLFEGSIDMGGCCLVVANQPNKYCRTRPSILVWGPTPLGMGVGWTMQINGPVLMSQRFKFCHYRFNVFLCQNGILFENLDSRVPCPFGWGAGSTPKILPLWGRDTISSKSLTSTKKPSVVGLI